MGPAYSYGDQRLDIQRDIDSYFGRPIEVTPRAMAALQGQEAVEEKYGDDERLGVYAYCVMDALLRSSPACALALFHAGVELEKLSFGLQADRPAPLAMSTLELLFEGEFDDFVGPGSPHHWTNGALAIRKSGILTDHSILISAVEAALHGEEYMDIGATLIELAGFSHSPRRRSDGGDYRASDRYLRKLLKRIRELTITDPSHSLAQFALFQDDKGLIRVRPFGATELSILNTRSPLRDGNEYVFRGGILQPLNSVYPGARELVLAELEDLINSQRVSERDFQRFFERYPYLLTGVDFRRAHPQPILHKDDGGSLIPDFFLEKLDGGWDAIMDLKRPYDDMVIRRRNRVYFCQDIHNAVAQLRFYSEWFDSPTNRHLFEASYGVKTYKPKMVIVVGRKLAFLDDVERIRLMDSLSARLELWTYDDVLKRAQRYQNLFPAPPEPREEGALTRANVMGTKRRIKRK